MFVFHGSSEEIEQVAKMHDIRLGEIERLEEVTVYRFDLEEEVPYSHSFVRYLYEFDNIILGPPRAMRTPEPFENQL